MTWTKGTVRVYETLNGVNHGKRTWYSVSGNIYNDVFDNGEQIRSKKVKTHEAFFTRSGAVLRAEDDDWEHYTAVYPPVRRELSFKSKF